MKLKTQLVAVMLLLVAAIPSQGASYTNNIVSGFNLIANQLNGVNNQLGTVISGAHDGDQILKWDYASQQFSDPEQFLPGVGWLPGTTTLNPGEGAFFFSSAAYSMTVSGTQGTPSLPLPYQSGYALVSRQIPGTGTFQNIMGDLPVNGTKFIRFNPATQTYSTNSFNGTLWSGGTPSANVGEAVFVFLPSGSPPAITQQPASQSTSDGQPVTFTVAASGAPPLSYQWRRNGSNIVNATTNRYIIPAAPLADNNAGFSVVIANSSGSVTSTVATLLVSVDNIPPTVRKVVNTTNFMQIKIAFSERVNGSDASDPSNYFIPGLSIFGVLLSPDGSNVTLTVSAMTEGANYSLSIGNIHDLSSSANLLQPNPALVTFQAAVPPTITGQPQDLAVNLGDPAELSVLASGTGPLTFQWYKGNNPLPNENSSQLVFPGVQQVNIGNYHVVVMNSAGAATSVVAKIALIESYTLDLPAGYSAIAKQLINPGTPFPPVPDSTQLLVWRAATGQFQSYFFGQGSWQPSEPALAPGEGAIIRLLSPKLLTFSGIRVTPMLPPNAPTSPALISAQIPINAGYNDIIGSPPQDGQVVYRLRGNASDPMLLDQNNYRLSYFRDGMWHDSPPTAAVGESVWVGYVEPVVIKNQPTGIFNERLGKPVSFSVQATGGAPLDYQWLLNGTPIPGATDSTYTIPALEITDAGLYTVAVGNVVGHIFSQTAPLTLDVPSFNMADNFSSQEFVSDVSRLLSFQNRNASREPGEPLHGGRNANASVWLTWVPQFNGIVTMSTVGSGFDTVLAAYVGNNVANLQLVDASDDDAGFAWSRISFNAVAGTPYRICVAGLGDERGDILLNWNLQDTKAVLPVILTQPQDVSTGYGTKADFTVVAGNDTVSYQWFRDGVPLPNRNSSTLTIPNADLKDVGYYFVRVFNSNRSRDSELVSLQLESPLPGEPFTGAHAAPKFLDIGIPDTGKPLKGSSSHNLIVGTVNRGFSGSISVSCALGRDNNEPYPCGIPGSNTIWYAVRSETNGTMYVNTDGSTFNTVIAAYIGPGTSYATLTNVACDNDSGLDGFDSRMSFPVTANRTNYIQVQGVGNTSGSVVLTYRIVRPLAITNLFYTNVLGGRFTMRVNSTSNLLTTVQYSTDLSSSNWVTLTNYTPNFTGLFNLTNNNVGPSSNRVYRALHVF